MGKQEKNMKRKETNKEFRKGLWRKLVDEGMIEDFLHEMGKVLENTIRK